MNSESLRLTDHQKRMKGAIVKIDSKCHPVYLGVNTVGRNKTAVVNIKNLNVSQTQALLILVDDTQHFLTDMNSFNGTYIDNTKLVPFKLYEVGNNAQIKFGDVKATYMKLTSNINTTINMTTSALEMTQNMTQQFYAADTQLMNGDISILDHLNNVSVNNKACNTTSVVSDIHEIETQKVNFQIELLTNNNSESNSEAKQIVMEEDMNIHDAPTQVVVYNPPIQKANENVDDPKECVDKSNELQSDDLPLNNLVIDEGSPSKKVERNTRSSSPGPSISLVHKTFEDSLFDNSKDDSTVPGIEIEETILDSKLEDACMDSNSNESLDFLAIGGEKNSYDEDKENIGIPVKEHSQETDLPRQLNKNNTVKQLSICTSDSVDSSSISARHSSEDTATKTAKIGMTNKPTNLNIEDNGDSDIETTQDLMKPKKKRLMNLLSNSDSESDMDDTQDIGFIKKPVKKLESDEETSINSNIIHSDSDTDCEAELVKTGEILLKKNIDNVPNEISKELSISLVTNVEKNLELNHKKVSELNRHSQSDSDKDKSKSNSQQSIKLFNVNASDSETIKLNDSDCIPATQDAFAEAFNYQPDPGTSSSTEDFRLGLTQIEESINNENSKLDQENTASINSEDVTDKICKENLQNPDDIYYIPTQQVTELPKALSDDDQETEAYLMPTQQILKNKDTTPCSVTTENDLYDLPTQQFSTVKNTPADDIYILPTQPLTIESQFKVPKYFTFKKKTVLDESLSTLLGDNKKDDDIFNAATQKMSASSEAQNISDMFDMATQIVSGPSILDDDNTEKDTENNLYIQSTQRIESSADNIKGLESNSVQLQSLVTENNPKAFYPGPLDVPTQPAILQNHDGVNTQEELELWSTSNAPELDEGRPNNPIAEVLNEGNTNEHSQKNNVGCSRGKPSSSHEQLGDKLGEQLTPLPVIKDVPPADTRPEVEPHSTVYSGDDEEETIETLSQIEAFIKKPIDNMSFKTRISKKVPLNTKCRDSLRRSSTKTKGDIIHETTAETITPKRTSKRKNYVQEEINNTSIKRKPTDKEQLESNSEGECNKDIKSDVDQSFALLESKATKSRKKVIDPVVQDFKVTVTSHRRSMNIAESSMIQTNISRTTRMSSYSKNKCKVAVKNKLKPKNEDSEFSESDISDRDNYKKDAISNVKVVIPNRIRRGTSGSKLLTTSKTVESSDEALPSHTVETTPGKRKRIAQYTDNAKSTSEAGSSEISNDTDFCPTLKRQRNIKEEELSSAERSRRKLKPKVVFTMFDNPQLEGIIRKLGGSIVDSVNSCTVLITEHVKRSQKLLAAVGQGKPICSPQWIKESNKAGEFLDPWDFILTDREAETKWEFSLHESLNRAKNQKLLNEYVFLILTSNATDVLKGAIEASGGKCLLKTPTKKSGAEFIAVASPDQKSKFTKLSKQNPNIKVVEPEAIFDGVLRQEMRLSKHLLI